MLPLVVLLVSPACRGADWPQWRGPERNGIAAEVSGWPGNWPPKLLWRRNVGCGCSSPVLAGGRLYVMGWHQKGSPQGSDTVLCLDPLTGAEIWSRSYPCLRYGRVKTGDEGSYGGPSSTPTYDTATGFLYTLSIDGDLRCWNGRQNGAPVWALNLYEEYKVPQRPDVGGGRRDYGFTSSPLPLGSTIVVEVGAGEGTVMAFDKKTGERRWASTCTEPAGHSGGPVLIDVEGKPCLATLALRKLVVMRLDPGRDGETLAEYQRATDFGCNIPTPAVLGNRLVLTSGYNQHRTTLVEILSSGAVERWNASEHAVVCSPVIYKGRVFMVSGPLFCLDLATGKRKWAGGKFGNGTCLITAGDDKVLVFGNGQLVLVDAAPAAAGYRELARVPNLVPDICYPHVAISDGIIACKDKGGNLVCLSVRGRQAR